MTITLHLSPGSTAAALRHAARAAEAQARRDLALAAILLSARTTAAITLAGALFTLIEQVLG